MKWKDIPRFEGRYIISEFGQIKRLDFKMTRKNRWGSINEYTMKGMDIKSRCCDGRYLSVTIQGDFEMVHRLVALAFIPNPESKPFVNHKDCNRMNNHYSNLEWVTGQENMDHAVRNGLLNHVCAKKLNADLVRQIKAIPTTVPSIQVAVKFNVNSRIIRAIRLKEIWKYV